MAPHATAAIATNSPATGLVQAATSPAAAATPGRHRCIAAMATRPTAIPSANVTRPTTKFVTVAVANQRTATVADSGHTRRTIDANTTEATTPAINARYRGSMCAASTGITML